VRDIVANVRVIESNEDMEFGIERFCPAVS
jgi:hypothetical protein